MVESILLDQSKRKREILKYRFRFRFWQSYSTFFRCHKIVERNFFNHENDISKENSIQQICVIFVGFVCCFFWAMALFPTDIFDGWNSHEMFDRNDKQISFHMDLSILKISTWKHNFFGETDDKFTNLHTNLFLCRDRHFAACNGKLFRRSWNKVFGTKNRHYVHEVAATCLL